MVIFVNWKELLENRSRLFWLAHTAGWFGFAFVHYLGSLQHDSRDIFVVIIFLNAYAGWLFTVPLRYIYRKAWNFPPIKIALVVILSSYFTGVLWQIVKNINYWEIYKHGYEPEFWFMYTQNSLGSFYIILSWSGLYFGSKYYQMLQIEKQNVLKANAVAHQAQLKMLRYQLNPHFLFNTLNAISTLILIEENKTANTMVTKLSEFLRYSLDKDPMKKVTLESEIQALQLYLAIEQVRFEDRLQLDFQINDNCQQALVPSMILQPLAENAIKHAIAVQEQGGSITISVNRFADDLLIEVADNGPGADIINGNLHRESGVGLVNTRERLQALYNEKFSLVVSNNQPTGVKVNLRMPFQLS
ncbi:MULTISPECIES: sensor histidine kinase [Colwellia]|uniref:Sensor histidine kinase n=1 Tax=Colwellia psychrerythraea (strain 34H / ATCC BAA-681) TaxID=167879 RepID=Q482M0_COLP3|nr:MULTISPECIES: histidine kinase [Colwellia]AAZ28493.1 sensor histidine kinase [Colwellia psychrerythraea 34H]